MLKRIIGSPYFDAISWSHEVSRAPAKHVIVDITAYPRDGPLRPEHVIVKPKFLQQVSRETYLAKKESRCFYCHSSVVAD
jgi:hypothetical protein